MCEAPTIFREDKVTARKKHWCCECRDTISIGESYYRSKGLWDGRWDEFKTCETCSELRHEIEAHLPLGEGIVFGELYEHVEDE